MIAIGFSLSKRPTSLEMGSLGTNGAFVLHASEEKLRTPQERLKACVLCNDQMETFLPLAPKRPIAMIAAAEWAAQYAEHLRAELLRLAELTQMSIRISDPSGEDRKSSLRARAEARQNASKLAAALGERLGASAMCVGGFSGQHSMHALVERKNVPKTLGQLAPSAPPMLPHGQVLVTGPWPPFHFFEGPVH